MGARWLTRLVPAALLASVVALYNGFPLTYPDSGNYLENALAIAHGRMPWFFYRPVLYGAFLTPFASAQTIWLIPVAQGLLLAFVVDLSLRASSVSLSTPEFLVLFAGLSAFTSLPWVSGEVMPDVLTGVVILLCFVSVWGGDRQALGLRCCVGALLAFAIGAHVSHLPLYAMLVAGTLGGRLLADRACRSWQRGVPLAVAAVAPLAVAAALLAGSNYYASRKLVLSRSSSLFALAHLVGDGLAQRYLARACPAARYLLCAERDSLRADLDWFLWDAGGPWKRHEPAVQRGDSTFLREAPAIVRGTLRQEWRAAIGMSLEHAIMQIGEFGLHPGELTFSRSVAEALQRLGPGTLASYRASRQVRKSLPLEAASRVQYAVVCLGAIVLLAGLLALSGRSLVRLRALIAAVCLGLVLNALVVAGLATVHPRYQSRVVWLLPLVGVVTALEAIRARRADRPPRSK